MFDKGSLGELQRWAYDQGFPIVSEDVASFLSFLVSVKKPADILEIGCAVGFSAALFAFYASDAKVTTIERYEYMANYAKKHFKDLGISGRINLIEEDAAVVLPRLVSQGKSYDFIFMDCAKGQYINFLPYILKLLKPDGIFCADDVLQGGNTLDKKRLDVPRRRRTTHTNLRRFLKAVMEDKTLQSVILPIGDGLLVANLVCHVGSGPIIL
jgi:predicted O-methyltransferase YrrM